jgi:transcriptional antiterminator Rof (Rho-off)
MAEDNATDDYQPVSCDMHDRFEAAAVKKQDVELEFNLEGVVQRERGRIADVYSVEGKEFVKFVSPAGPVDIQLDHIIDMREV